MGNDEMSDAIEILQKVISRKNYTPLSLQEFEELAMVHNVLAKAVDVEGLLEGVIQILNHARCIVNKPPVGNRELANRIIKHLAAQGYIGVPEDVKKYREHLEMFYNTNNLNAIHFISEAKVRAGRNGAIVSEEDHILISHFCDVVKENIDKELNNDKTEKAE